MPTLQQAAGWGFAELWQMAKDYLAANIGEPLAFGLRAAGYMLVAGVLGLLAGANCPSRATGYYRADDLPDTCNYSHSSGVAAAQSADTAPVVGQDTTGMDTD